MRRSTIPMILAASFLATVLTGCSMFEKEEETDALLLEEQEMYLEEEDMDVSMWAIFKDPTPELVTVSFRQEDVDRLVYRDINMDMRQLWDDWMTAMYWDRVSRLNRRPIP